MSLINCTVARNGESFGGGAIWNGTSEPRGTVSIINSTVNDNAARAIVNTGETVIITNSTIAGNSGGFGGGGIVTSSSLVIITNSTIAGNSGGDFGGGILTNPPGTVIITNSTIAGNSGANGGGIYTGDTVTIINSTITDNTGEFGGGISAAGPVTIINSTIAGNRAGESSGGIFNSVGTVELRNTMLAGNTTAGSASDCSGAVTSVGHNLIGDISDCDVTLQASDLTGDPGLGEFTDDGTPGHGHFPLLASSRAIDAGDHEVCAEDPRLATDQLGHPRVGICDIGAIEFPHPIVLVNDLVTFDPLRSTFTFTPDPSGCPEGFVGTFRFEARLTNTSERVLTDLFAEVITVTGGNLLHNADGGPGGVGARLTLPQEEALVDGVLSPEEVVEVPFLLCLQERQPFQFAVDVFGVVDASTEAHARAPFVNSRRAWAWAPPPE